MKLCCVHHEVLQKKTLEKKDSHNIVIIHVRQQLHLMPLVFFSFLKQEKSHDIDLKKWKKIPTLTGLQTQWLLHGPFPDLSRRHNHYFFKFFGSRF